MKLFLFVATEKGLNVLNALVDVAPDKIAGVCSFKESSVTESFYDQIKESAENAGLKFFNWKEVSADVEEALASLKTTHVMAASWRYLLPTSLNETLKNPILVFHDSLLPRYRGFAPLPSAMINGEKEIGFTVLFAAEETDAGDIVLQRSFELSQNANIADAISMIAQGYGDAAKEVVKMIDQGNLQAQPQNQANATYSIWRDEQDMQIDWSQSSDEIYNFIRALGKPYKGAWSVINNERVTILESSQVSDQQFEIRQPGKLWRLENGAVTVVCGKGMLKLTHCLASDGTAFKFDKLRQRFQ